jgi:DEAD/DEAH box helicase domain-containing protein
LVLRKTPAGYIYSGRERPQEVVTLDAIEQRAIEVVVEGRVIETLDRARAYREAHPGAVLLHQGETYVVQKLDLENRRAEAEKKSVDYYTGVIEHEEVRLVEELESRPFGAGCALGLSRIQVTERITGYRMKRYDRLLATHPLDLPPVEFKTIGVWLQLEANLPDELARQGFDFMGSIHGAEHALISLAPLLAMCDPRDLGGASYRLFPEKQLPAILIYDGFENGIGISEKLFAEFDRLVGMTCDLVGRCACDEGCPACVLSPRCGDGNQPMSKPGARAVLERLAGACRSGL